tara:strand:- start:1556 stop:2140 length:585 start_codon:yes stop_codon:yes gene_type:complete
MKIETKRFKLRNIVVSDATKEYLSWINFSKENILRSSEIKNLSDLKKFIKKVKSKKDINYEHHLIGLGRKKVEVLKKSYSKKNIKTIFLAIIDKKNNKHIGNIKYDPIDVTNKFAVMGILIGNPDYRGKKVFKEVFIKTSEHIFLKYKINKIYLGLKKNNLNALSAYKRLGFKIHKSNQAGFFMSIDLSNFFNK